MAETTAISWTHHTFNPWMGCTKVSPACAHCYAARQMDEWLGKVKWGPQGTRVVTGETYWCGPLKWNAAAEAAGERRRVFCASLADVFEDWGKPVNDSRGFFLNRCRACDAMYAAFSGDKMCDCHCRERDLATMDDLRRDLFKLIDSTPWLDWLLLTKRPENIRRMFVPHCCDRVVGHVSQNAGDGYYLRQRGNVWLGTTVENQEEADKRIPELLKCRDLSPVLFLSCEPLLGRIALGLTSYPDCKCGHSFDDEWPHGRPCGTCGRSTQEVPVTAYQAGEETYYRKAIDWVIAGGESGREARPSHPDWFRSLRDQCQSAAVAFHFKQHGEWVADDRLFMDYTNWCNKASTWVNGGMCVDATGRVCRIGKDFMEATYPIAIMHRVGVKDAGRLLDGREWNEFPERS